MKGKLKYKQKLKVSNDKAMSLQYDSLSESARKCTPTGKCTQMCIRLENLKHCHAATKGWRQYNIQKTSNDARIITLKLNPSRGTVLPHPHGKGNKCDFTRTRQIIRYRATATPRRLQTKQCTAANEGGYKTNGNILKFEKYVAVYPTAISQNNSSYHFIPSWWYNRAAVSRKVRWVFLWKVEEIYNDTQ